MPILMVRNFIEHSLWKLLDAAAVATGAAYVVPEWRAAIHEWGLVADDSAPIFAVLWLAIQIVCKLYVTVRESCVGNN